MKLLPWCVVMLAACVLVGVWTWNNGTYPRDDEGYYVLQAWRSYKVFQQGQWLNFIETAYYDRGWKPVLHHLGVLPALILSGGNVRLSVETTILFWFLAFLTYVYLLARTFLAPWRAALGALAFAVIPWVLRNSLHFMPETPFLTCVAAVFFHLRRSAYFSNRRHASLAGLWLGLSACIRPVEAVVFFGSGLLPLTYFLIRTHRISARVASIPLVLAVLLGVIGFLVVRSQSELGLLATLGLASIGLLPLFKRQAWPPFLPPLLHAFGLIGAWYGPKILSFYSWAYDTAFGEIARESARAPAESVLRYFIDVYNTYVGPFVLGLSALAILGVAWAYLTRTRRTPEGWDVTADYDLWENPEHRQWYLILLPMVFVFPAIGAATANPDLRYYCTSAFVVIGSLIVLALLPQLPASRGRAGALLALTLLFGASAIDGYKPVREDVVEVLVERLERALPGEEPVRIVVMPLTMVQHGMVNPFAMMLAAQERGLPWKLDWPYPFNAKSADEVFQRVRNGFDYILIGADLEKDAIVDEDRRQLRALLPLYERVSVEIEFVREGKSELKPIEKILLSDPYSYHGRFMLYAIVPQR